MKNYIANGTLSLIDIAMGLNPRLDQRTVPGIRRKPLSAARSNAASTLADKVVQRTTRLTPTKLTGFLVKQFVFYYLVLHVLFIQYGLQLHTLEDFPAHSNFCELALVMMGHHDVFTHVGDQCRIQAPGGKHVAPLVTGETSVVILVCRILIRMGSRHFRI